MILKQVWAFGQVVKKLVGMPKPYLGSISDYNFLLTKILEGKSIGSNCVAEVCDALNRQ